MSIILPGVQTMISHPRFNSAICSEIPAPPYTQTVCNPKDFVNFFASDAICMASSLVGVSNTAVVKEMKILCKTGYQHFILFPRCFQKIFFFRVVESRDRVIKELTKGASFTSSFLPFQRQIPFE